MGGSSNSTPSNTSSTTSTKPWSYAVPYLANKKYKPQTQIFADASQFYDQFSNLNSQQKGLNSAYLNTLQGRNGQTGAIQNTASSLMNGGYDPRYADTQAYTSNLPGAFNSMGAANPMTALQQSLSGKIDNPYLQSMHEASINTSMRGYNDALQQLQQQVMPGIGDNAFAAGQYGSSRQGIAEGMALQEAERNARDLGIAGMDYGNQLYGNAYQNAQNLMGQTAQSLSSLGAQNAQFNAGNQQNANQFNANLDLQQQAAAAQNAQNGINAYQNAFGMADNTFNQMQSILAAPQVQQQNALNQYANIVSPGAGYGGTQSTSIPIYNNNMGQLLGGGLGMAGLLSSLGQ